MNRLFALAFLFLAACGGGTTPPPPAPAPLPLPALYAADWTAPGLVGLACDESVPPACSGAAPWLTFDRPGTQGRACAEPLPNACLALEGGRLAFTPGRGSPGFPIFTNRTFAGGFEAEAEVTAECLSQYCYFGLVAYNGELNYRATYLAWAPNGIQVWLYAPTVAVPLTATVYPQGSTLLLGIAYQAGEWRYYVNRVQVGPTETQGTVTPDAALLSADPHLAIFAGDVVGRIGRLEVYPPR